MKTEVPLISDILSTWIKDNSSARNMLCDYWGQSFFEGFLVEHNLSLFKNKSELIIANRFSEDLSD